MQSQGPVLPPEHEVGPSSVDVSKKESCVNPSKQDPNTGASDTSELYVDENSPRMVALGRVYEGSTTVHNSPLGNDQVKVDVKEVWDVDARIPLLQIKYWLSFTYVY